MAGIDTGGHSGKRASNHEIPLIPFIDFLLCLVMFLLVTAVWSHMARIEADAKVPGPPRDDEPDEIKPEKELHVHAKERKFQLVWKEGSTVVDEMDVDRKEVKVGDDVSFPDLSKQIEKQWGQHGSHRAASDKKFDKAVLHTDNNTEFGIMIAVLDAMYTPHRKFKVGSSEEDVPSFHVTFAHN